MSDTGVQPQAEAAPEGAGLTQWQRAVDMFMAPSKTFEDIKRGNESWWLPLIIGSLFTYLLFGAVARRSGYNKRSKSDSDGSQGAGAHGAGLAGTASDS